MKAVVRAKDASKTERIEFRVTPKQKRLIELAIQLQGSSMSEFVAASAVRAAKRTVREEQEVEKLVLTIEEKVLFTQAILNPRPATPELLELLSKRRMVLGGDKLNFE